MVPGGVQEHRVGQRTAPIAELPHKCERRSVGDQHRIVDFDTFWKIRGCYRQYRWRSRQFEAARRPIAALRKSGQAPLPGMARTKSPRSCTAAPFRANRATDAPARPGLGSAQRAGLPRRCGIEAPARRRRPRPRPRRCRRRPRSNALRRPIAIAQQGADLGDAGALQHPAGLRGLQGDALVPRIEHRQLERRVLPGRGKAR